MQRWITLGLAIGLAALACVAHAPALEGGFVNYDDDLLILQSAALREGLTPASLRWALTSTEAANWFPLTRLSWLVDAELFGLDARAFHRTSWLLHAANAALLFLALARLTGARAPSACVAALFAVHPLHVESVAWAASRKDLLAGTAAFLALLAHERAVRGARAWHAGVFVALAAGLAAKPVLVTLPFALLLLDVWPLRRFGPGGTSPARAVAEKLPLFALAAGACVLTLATQTGGGTVQSLERYPLAARVGNALVSVCVYLRRAFWPDDLAVFYPHPGAPTLPVALAAAVAIAVPSAVALALRRRAPALLVGWLWFGGMLVPVSGIVQVGQAQMADRYTYLPLVGLWVALVFGGATLLVGHPRARRALGAGVAVAVVALVVAAREQARTWRDSETLFRHALHVTRDNHVAHVNLGIDLANRGHLEEGARHLARAQRLAPGSATAAGALGEVRLKQGRAAEALALLRAARAREPASARWRAGIGAALRERGDARGAEAAFRAALERDAAHAGARIQLAALLVARGEPREALATLAPLREHGNDDPGLHAVLGAAHAALGDAERARGHFERSLERHPTADAHARLARLLAGRDDAGAIAHLEAAVRLAPDEAGYRAQLARRLLAAGRAREAAVQYRAALEADGEDRALRNNLAWALLRAGGSEAAREALAHAEAASAAGPPEPALLDTLAAARAAAGRWSGAAEAAERGLALARERGDAELAADLAEKLADYRERERASR